MNLTFEAEREVVRNWWRAVDGRRVRNISFG